MISVHAREHCGFAMSTTSETSLLYKLMGRLWSSYIGHDPSLSIESLQISFPAIDKQLDDRALYSEGANLTIASMVSTTFHWTCRLAALEERIMLAV